MLPLVALAIGAWLGWRAYDQAGVLIQVRFESSDGIQAKKTEVLYKGIAVGKVVALDVSEDIKGVVATIEMDKEARQYLSKGTRFWLVKPRVSLAGVTGLEHKTSNWSAIWVLPLVALAIGAWLAWRAFDQAGVDIQVRFESGDGIQANKTEVLYKGISVGKVTDLHVSKDIKGVVATIEIKKEAQEYLSKDTRFWLVKPRVSLAGVTGLVVRHQESGSLF